MLKFSCIVVFSENNFLGILLVSVSYQKRKSGIVPPLQTLEKDALCTWSISEVDRVASGLVECVKNLLPLHSIIIPISHTDTYTHTLAGV